ncbi:MAG: MGMT family protein [Planctomycetes bacterium]|nr:MGMT family protein [Planctomycetota bacterium]
MATAHCHDRIYAIVRQIPPGRVATYGQVAAIEGRCTPRRVGHALAVLPADRRDVPWQRVLNSQGRVSDRAEGSGAPSQREVLHGEGVLMDARGRVDFAAVGWAGPDLDWLLEHGLHPAPPAGTRRRR